MMQAVWVLPTLHRPHNLKRLIESYRAVGERAKIYLMLWQDDPDLSEYQKLSIPEEWTINIRAERFTASDAMRALVTAYPRADSYGFLGDDVVFHTKWKDELAQAAAPCFIAYPDDCLQHERLCTHFVCGGDLVRALGYWALPGIVHSGLDWVWMLIGYNVRGLLKYCPQVIFEHMHYIVGKAASDKVNDFALSHIDNDDAIFQKWMRGDGLRNDVMKAREVLDGAIA